jgi:hypothetical protein
VLTIGEATVRAVRLLVRDLPSRRGGEAAEFDGVLGIGLFAEHLLTLDYPARRVRIGTGELTDGADGVVAYQDRFGIPQVKMTIGTLEVDADVDSGNLRGELVLPDSFIGKVALEGEPRVVGTARTGFNEFEIRQARLAGDVHLGTVRLERPLVDFVAIFPHGNLGHAFLGHFVVTIDQKNKRLRLAAWEAAA